VEAFRKRSLPAGAGPILLTLGRISQRKNLGSLVRAFALFVEDEPTAVLVVAGPDSEGLTEELRREATAHGLERRVVFTGRIAGEAKSAALAVADVFVLASKAENFSLVLGEALATGLPSVVSSSIDLAPDLERERAAMLVVPTPEGLAGGLRRLWGDPDERELLERNGRRFARRLEPDRIGQMWAELYRALSERPDQERARRAAQGGRVTAT
jgi:glycosyltransferase involved in cell wall biosynthesis